jgi:alpha-glucosidase
METSSAKPWWHTGVIYQIYPRSYQDSNGDGVGDLAGILQRLEYLSDVLGVDAIWLSPFYPSPMADFGYDVSNYTNVHPLFGDLATFDQLVGEAHRRKLRVIIDFVPNHTSNQHPWFLESKSSRSNPKRNWYFWRDAKLDGSLPNNWLSLFGGVAWEWEAEAGQYYLHTFLKEQPDLNWRNPAVKVAMLDVIRFWLERGVDGFRLDVAHFIMKDPDLRDNPPNPDVSQGNFMAGDYSTQLHINDMGHADVHGVFREFRTLLDSYSQIAPRYSVGEIHIADWKEWVKYYGKNLDELHMPFNFSLMRAPWNPAALRQVVDRVEAALPAGAWPNYVLGNHDEPRLATRYGKNQVRLAAMLLLTLRGTPTLYQGDELGMANVEIPPKKVQDPFGINVPGKGRDPNRTPMQWDAAPNAGFSSPSTPDLWLPLAPDYRSMNVQIQLKDSKSVLSLYRQLLALRRNTPAINSGRYQSLEDLPDNIYGYLRETNGQQFIVVLNFSHQVSLLNLGKWGNGSVRLSTELDRDGRMTLSGVELRPYEGLVIELVN